LPSGVPARNGPISAESVFVRIRVNTAYFGKWHVAIEGQCGFDTFVGKDAEMNPKYAAEFLKQEHDRPFLAVASFLSPHEICQWSRRQSLPGDELGPVPPLEDPPPLRENAEPPAGEADIMTHMRKSYQAYTRLFPVGDYTEQDWRRLIWGYYRLIERVDGFVGVVMTALFSTMP
jgi:choline-sulfatase